MITNVKPGSGINFAGEYSCGLKLSPRALQPPQSPSCGLQVSVYFDAFGNFVVRINSAARLSDRYVIE